jgi:hypothetical protein
MTCEGLLNRLGYDCHMVGDSTVLVETPFCFADGEPIHFYLEEIGEEVKIHDNADTLFHLAGIGMDIRSRKRWQGIKNAVSAFGFELEDSGLIVGKNAKVFEQHLLTQYISALLAVTDFEREHLGLTEEQVEFVKEVEFYLHAQNPGKDIIHSPSVVGHSGKKHNFHFEFDGKLVDALKPHGRATGSILRKVLDVANAGANRRFMVVIDDRNDPERAQTETDILHTMVSVVQFTALQRQSVGSSSQH